MRSGHNENPETARTSDGLSVPSSALSRSERRLRLWFRILLGLGMLAVLASLATLVPNPWAHWKNGLGYRSLCPWAPTAALVGLMGSGIIFIFAFDLYAKKIGSSGSSRSRGRTGSGRTLASRSSQGVGGWNPSPQFVGVAAFIALLTGFSWPFTERSLRLQREGAALSYSVRTGEQGPTQIPLDPDFPDAAGVDGEGASADQTGTQESGSQDGSGSAGTIPRIFSDGKKSNAPKTMIAPDPGEAVEYHEESSTDWLER